MVSCKTDFLSTLGKCAKWCIKTALLLFCFLPCVLLEWTYFFFLFQSLQPVTTRRNCQLDNAEESLHVITTGIIIGMLLKRLIAPPTDFCWTVKFSPRIAVIDFLWKKKRILAWHYGPLRAISSSTPPLTRHGLSKQYFSLAESFSSKDTKFLSYLSCYPWG